MKLACRGGRAPGKREGKRRKSKIRPRKQREGLEGGSVRFKSFSDCLSTLFSLYPRDVRTSLQQAAQRTGACTSASFYLICSLGRLGVLFRLKEKPLARPQIEVLTLTLQIGRPLFDLEIGPTNMTRITPTIAFLFDS
jgi:hypothetical protein